MAKDSDGAQKPNQMIEGTRLYERVSAKGSVYWTGRLGGLKVLVLPKRSGDDGEHSHVLMIAAAPPRGEREGGR